MRFFISPFGYISWRVVLAVMFTLAAIGILFFGIIIKVLLVGLIGFLGWCIGSIVDDTAFLHRWKYKIRNAFSGKGR